MPSDPKRAAVPPQPNAAVPSPSRIICGRCIDGDRDATFSAPPPSAVIHEETSPDTDGGVAISNAELIVQLDEQASQARHQDAFDQWNALVSREGAYSLHGLPSAPTGNQDDVISPSGRERLCIWCYKVVDHLDRDRGSVSVALSYFDRLLAADSIDMRDAPIAITTSLYLALKVNSPAPERRIAPEIMAGFSDGRFSAEEIVAAETRICEGFGWRLNPPVAGSYINIIDPVLRGLRTSGSPHRSPHEADVDFDQEMLNHLVEQSKFLCERIVLDAFFAGRSPASIAHAAVSVALRLMSFPQDTIDRFLSLPLGHDAEETDLCAARIRLICDEEGYRPAVTLLDHQASNEQLDAAGVEVVTPVQDKAPSSIKRARPEQSPTAVASVARPRSPGAVDYQSKEGEWRIVAKARRTC